ncbi:hypothetical protein [Mycolicibacterium helvum]|uniref:Uncharacterized protein n=1 Tax=Mycolicibacterium helvum TaxID=1534349 RepID=A0A7I7TEA8_9MYCO|nr:hypothetical protein [Mycolicibacterium helvum]BBY67562.1 hypothetical protein MHEL_58050 [Mycolicibacterium helvum]
MSTTSEDEKAFARTLFAPDDDDGVQALHNLFESDHGQAQGAEVDDGLDAQHRFAADLFAPEDPDADILPGLKPGRNVGRWRHPEPEPVDRGPWFDRR